MGALADPLPESSSPWQWERPYGDDRADLGEQRVRLGQALLYEDELSRWWHRAEVVGQGFPGSQGRLRRRGVTVRASEGATPLELGQETLHYHQTLLGQKGHRVAGRRQLIEADLGAIESRDVHVAQLGRLHLLVQRREKLAEAELVLAVKQIDHAQFARLSFQVII